jgi:hypothetical protein
MRVGCWVKGCRREPVYELGDGRQSCDLHYRERKSKAYTEAITVA